MSTDQLIIVCATAVICAFLISCGLSDIGGKHGRK